jgi:hypothetical protein
MDKILHPNISLLIVLPRVKWHVYTTFPSQTNLRYSGFEQAIPIKEKDMKLKFVLMILGP